MTVVTTVKEISDVPSHGAEPSCMRVTLGTHGGGQFGDTYLDISRAASASLAARINRHLYPGRSQVNFYPLPPGQTVISQPVEEFSAEAIGEPIADAILLRISLGIVPESSAAAGTLQPATSVAIRLDQLAATKLHSQICEIARTMGWPLPE
jgi:hypothetical protein